jgi:hypothetical protein
MKQQDKAPKDLKYFDSLLPAPECAICRKKLEQIGGRRITAQKLRGMAVWDFEASLHDRGNLIASERLIEGKNAYLVVWGEVERFTTEVVERMRLTYLNGLRPWMCQAATCGCRQCPQCGAANNLPVASDLLYSDGRNPHLMVVPADCGCTNVDCNKFREFEHDWEIVRYQNM